jgi:DNA-directed RNA polymerase specialized sigma24 family protein
VTRKTMMTPARFDAICELIGMRQSQSREAARMVMVLGYSGVEVARSTGVSKAGVYKATARIRKGLQLARQAVGLSDER